VQPKAVAHPTDAKLMHRAREKLIALAKKHGVALRQSYQRYAHAKQFKRARRELRRLRTILGRVMRDVARKIKGKADLREVFVKPLWRAERGKRPVRQPLA
jgi:IS5 family transposase